jgi:hypothetical protein
MTVTQRRRIFDDIARALQERFRKNGTAGIDLSICACLLYPAAKSANSIAHDHSD